MPYDKREYNRARQVVKFSRMRAIRYGLRLAQNQLTGRQWLDKLIEYDFRCHYCHAYGEEHVNELTIDHVIPLRKGGSNNKENIVPACRTCNRSKGVKERPTFPNFQTDKI